MGTIKENAKRIITSLATLRFYESILIYFLNLGLTSLGFIKVSGIKKEKKEILFIMGSGPSLRAITGDEWERFRSVGDFVGFNDSIYQNYVDLDYYVVRELEPKWLLGSKWRYASLFQSNFNLTGIKKIGERISANPKMSNTRFIVFNDILGGISLLWLWMFYGRFRRRIAFFYANLIDRSISWPISESYDNIPHSGATLFDCINIGYVMGYKKIVLLGVDLRNSDYFYLGENETRPWDLSINHRKSEPHKTAETTLTNIKRWGPYLELKGVTLLVQNRNSLLAGTLPVFSMPVE
jgi:hypothetical protein